MSKYIFTSKVLVTLDKIIYRALKKYRCIMPERIIKLVAYYYPDPYIRREYFEDLGVIMGENTLANLGLTVIRPGKVICVEIGDNVSIAPNVTFICDSCANNGNLINKIPYVRDVLTKSGKIVVEDEVWIGTNATIFPGVKIGKCSVIGAGSIVLEDVDAYSIYAGVPAKKIRSLEKFKEGID